MRTDVDTIGFKAHYAIRCAVDSDNLAQVRKLLWELPQLRPDCNVMGGSSPLHYACTAGAVETVEFFLTECGCNPNSCNSPCKMTPSHVAAIQGHAKILKILYKNGADFRVKDEFAENILHKSCMKGSTDFLYFVVNEFELFDLVLDPDANGREPLGFLREHIAKELHPLQLSRRDLTADTPELEDLVKYLTMVTKGALNWANRKLPLKVRLKIPRVTLV